MSITTERTYLEVVLFERLFSVVPKKEHLGSGHAHLRPEAVSKGLTELIQLQQYASVL